jgi:hypothetical protein
MFPKFNRNSLDVFHPIDRFAMNLLDYYTSTSITRKRLYATKGRQAMFVLLKKNLLSDEVPKQLYRNCQ